ncbi:hypothetical protein TNCV_3157261 [Trichonephila clavipes]|nr:hypothetical protein TNCV_3157261 [Trichonephila clavipes]
MQQPERRIEDYPSDVSVNVLDESKQLQCESGITECKKNRKGRSHPPRCTMTRGANWIVPMAVTDRKTTPQTITQPIQSATYHWVSARTIRHRLHKSGMSARHLLLLPETSRCSNSILETPG